MSNDEYMWEKEEKGSSIWWKYYFDRIGEYVFSFDKEKEYNLFADYPWKLTPEEKEIFDKENPYWVEFFKDRQPESVEE